MIATGSLEPIDGGPVGDEPTTGWRVWRVAGNRLYSIAKSVYWQPGENQAECLDWQKHDAPAPSCHCGFWALRNPVPAMQLAAQVNCGPKMTSGFTPLDTPRTIAVGLIRGYGAIAVHGSEGFRAGLASVACIFTDAPEPPTPEHADLRRAVAANYGVPCIALDAAISIGFLQELGVSRQAVEQTRAWIEAGRPLAEARRPPISITMSSPRNESQVCELTEHELQIVHLVAQGMTNAEIARSISLNSRAVDFHIYRLVEKTGLRSRADLAHWVAKRGG